MAVTSMNRRIILTRKKGTILLLAGDKKKECNKYIGIR